MSITTFKIHVDVVQYLSLCVQLTFLLLWREHNILLICNNYAKLLKRKRNIMKEITIIILLVTMLCMTFCNLMSAFFLQQKFQSHLKTKCKSNTWYYLTNIQFVISTIISNIKLDSSILGRSRKCINKSILITNGIVSIISGK